MPLCTVAEIKHAARVDADITEHDAMIPMRIAQATAQIEQHSNVPRGWFEAMGPSARGYESARWACIALCARWIDEPSMLPDAILNSRGLDEAYYGDMPTLPTSTIPAGAIGLSGLGALHLDGAGLLVLA